MQDVQEHEQANNGRIGCNNARKGTGIVGKSSGFEFKKEKKKTSYCELMPLIEWEYLAPSAEQPQNGEGSAYAEGSDEELGSDGESSASFDPFGCREEDRNEEVEGNLVAETPVDDINGSEMELGLNQEEISEPVGRASR